MGTGCYRAHAMTGLVTVMSDSGEPILILLYPRREPSGQQKALTAADGLEISTCENETPFLGTHPHATGLARSHSNTDFQSAPLA